MESTHDNVPSTRGSFGLYFVIVYYFFMIALEDSTYRFAVAPTWAS